LLRTRSVRLNWITCLFREVLRFCGVNKYVKSKKYYCCG
jgi:hypothetical protein